MKIIQALHGDNIDPDLAEQERKLRDYEVERHHEQMAQLYKYSQALGKSVKSEADVLNILRIVGEIGESRDFVKDKVDRLINAYRRA